MHSRNTLAALLLSTGLLAGPACSEPAADFTKEIAAVKQHYEETQNQYYASVDPIIPGTQQADRYVEYDGMGSVYRAQRADGLFDQTVAIKFMRAKQGAFDLGPLIDAERRALARMDHESIARILDGGVTQSGLSYLVMEYVAGEPLDDDCEARALSVAERVALVRQVAGALAHGFRPD